MKGASQQVKKQKSSNFLGRYVGQYSYAGAVIIGDVLTEEREREL